jgi:hypothetical protein
VDAGAADEAGGRKMITRSGPPRGGRSRRTVRVSFSALLRVRDDDRYLLFHSPSRPGSFGPPGGVFKYFEPAVATLEQLRFRADRVEARGEIMREDLRGFIPAASVRGFVRWFDSGAYREDSAECLHRELVEELGEIGFPDLAPEARELTFTLVSATLEGPHEVPGKPYRQLRRFEVHDLVATAGAAARLRRRLVELGRDPAVDTVRCVTGNEIAHGRSGTALIGPQSAFLVDARRIHPDLPSLR